MFRSARILVGLILAAALASCAQSANYLAPEGAVSQVPVAAPAEYSLGVGDRLRVDIFGEPALSGEFQVARNGSITLPLIGEIPAVGRTPSQLDDAITSGFAGGYLRDPKVGLTVLTYRPFYILGEVNKAGEYPYTVGLTALNAIATAGGFTYRADTRKIYIKRAGQGSETEMPLNTGVAVAPGDTLRVGERFF